MSAHYKLDFELNEVEEVQCDMPGCQNFYHRLLYQCPRDDSLVRCLIPEWEEDEGKGWVMLRFPVAEDVEGRADYCPICARKLGFKSGEQMT